MYEKIIRRQKTIIETYKEINEKEIDIGSSTDIHKNRSECHDNWYIEYNDHKFIIERNVDIMHQLLQ